MRTRGLRSNTTAAAAGWLCALLLVLVGCHDSNSNVTGDSSSVPQPAANERAEPGEVAQEADQVPIAPGAGQPSSAKAPVPVAATEPAPQFTQERLEQLVAPVALYPDPLLMDVLMAATYPAEVAEAAAWVKQNPGMNGKALDDAIADKGWDVSVNSLTHATQAIELMGQDPQWTSDLGEAFLAQQNDVLNAVQVMRSRACDLGHLKTNAQQRVEIRPAPPPPPHPAQYIVPPPPRIVSIYPVQPELLYVPVYNPGIIFGPPPPVVFYPRAYVYPGIAVGVAPVITFGVGVAIAGLFWGDVDWHHHHSYRRRYDSGYYYGNYGNYGRADYWRHDVYHRRGYNYRQPALEQRYGHASRREWSNRDQYRGSRDGTASVNDQRAGGQRPHGRGGDKGKVGSQRGDGAGRPGSNGPSKNVGGSKGKGGPDSGNRGSSAGRGGGKGGGGGGKGSGGNRGGGGQKMSGGGGGQHGGASRGSGGQRGGGGGGGKGGGGKGGGGKGKHGG